MAKRTPAQAHTDALKALLENKGIGVDYHRTQTHKKTHTISLTDLATRDKALKIAADHGYKGVVATQGKAIAVPNAEYVDPKGTGKSKLTALRPKVVIPASVLEAATKGVIPQRAKDLRALFKAAGISTSVINDPTEDGVCNLTLVNAADRATALDLATKAGYTVQARGTKGVGLVPIASEKKIVAPKVKVGTVAAEPVQKVKSRRGKGKKKATKKKVAHVASPKKAAPKKALTADKPKERVSLDTNAFVTLLETISVNGFKDIVSGVFEKMSPYHQKHFAELYAEKAGLKIGSQELPKEIQEKLEELKRLQAWIASLGKK